MKDTFLYLAVVCITCLCINIHAQVPSTKTHKMKNENLKTGEDIFVKHADKCLAIIEEEAQKLPIKGVALIAFIPGESTGSWISKMKVVGALTSEKSNFLGVASSKAAEMADLLQDSGSGIREPKKGEYGYKGGVIKKVKYGYVLAVFSGGTSEQDAEVAKLGLNWLCSQY